MSGFLVHVGATVICPHGGTVNMITTNSRVLVGGMPAVTATDQFLVAGCAFTVGSKPQPCVVVRWLAPSTRILINGQPAVLQLSTNISQSVEQIPQGPAIVATTQGRAMGL